MYEQFFGLRDRPFSLTPNPRFVFYSKQYHEAEGQLIYGIANRESLMVVTGASGAGKTTLCCDLVQKLGHENTRAALILDPFLSGAELLAALLTEFGVTAPPDATRTELLDRLSQFLRAQLALGKRCVAIFDEAQHLSLEFLEQIRVLSNLETNREKLVQIVLVGQPELLERLRAPQTAQLDQRVSIRCTLSDLDERETERYIQHRLDVAGARDQIRFSGRALRTIHRASRGVPRLINLISDRALLAGFASQTRDIQVLHVRKAVAALRGEDGDATASTGTVLTLVRRIGAMAAIGGLAAATVGVTIWPKYSVSPDEAAYRLVVATTGAPDAERALETFVRRFAASKHLDAALLRLAQLEIAHGDRATAIENLERLAQHTPASLERTRAVVFASQARLDSGDTTSACQSLSPDLTSAAAADTSLAHQLTAISSLCAERVGSASVAADTSAHPAIAPDTAAAKGPARRRAAAGAAP